VLLDELMPLYDVSERHHIQVHADPEAVFAAIREADLTGGSVTRLLLALRALPAGIVALVRSPRATWVAWRRPRRDHSLGVRLAYVERQGFHIVAERAPEELVIGVLGSFWTLRGSLCADVSRETFREGPPAGLALAGWNFSITSCAPGVSQLRTETRVLCAADARWKFRLYWLAVRPGSGLIRRAMLRAIRREAEREAHRTDHRDA
jgi:hypothetical protein